MKKAAAAFAAATLCSAWGAIGLAQPFLLGEETGGVKVKGPEGTELTARILLQGRADAGDLVASRDGRGYASETDIYLRRVRLETDTAVAPKLSLSFGLEADRAGQMGQQTQVRVRNANVDYRFVDALSVRFGRGQIPLSRAVVTSSARLLFIESPASTEAAKKLFGDEIQPHLLVYGKAGGGIFAWRLAAGDGWEPNAAIAGYATGADNTVARSGLMYIARVDLSPPGWVETIQSDAPLGRGRHLKAGAHYAFQDGIEYKGSGNEEDRTVWGVDLSGHAGGFAAQAEYTAWTIDSTSPIRGKVSPRGWYAQAGYFFAGPNIEPCARYEAYDTNGAISDAKVKIVTGGLNWYLKGHGAKLSLNWVRTDYGRYAAGALSPAQAVDHRQHVFQLLAQLYM